MKRASGTVGRREERGGMCPSGKHGLDYEGQLCDLCDHDAGHPNIARLYFGCSRCGRVERKGGV